MPPAAPTRRRLIAGLAALPWIGRARAAADGASAAAGGAAAGTAAPLSADQARRDLRILQRAFTALHPGLYRYASPAQIEAAFAAANAAVAAGCDAAQVFLHATRLAAAVRCGHTWTNPYNQGPTLRAALEARADKLPLALRAAEGRFLVTGSAAPGVAAGAELLAIDGREMPAIVAALLPLLRADGANDDKRLAQVDDGSNGGELQRLLGLLFPPADGAYRLRLRDAAGGPERELRVAALTAAARQRALAAVGVAPPSSAWRLELRDDIALMSLPTFAFWNDAFDGVAELRRSFATLQERRIPYLVIDLRANEGGDDALAAALLGHLLTAPYTGPSWRRESAYERVPYELARFLDTWDFSFFDRTGQVRPGPGRNRLLPDQAGETIAPRAPGYRGRVIALVGPDNSSAGQLLAEDLQRSGAALLVGRRTGGSLRGLNGGQICWLTLPESGASVDIPLTASFADGDPPDRGVIPEVEVAHRFADLAAGTDPDLVAARELIAGWRRAG